MADEAPEFSRIVRLDQIGGDDRPRAIAADEAERAALAKRFGLRGIDRLEADYALRSEAGGVRAEGVMRADAVQACVATGQDVPARIEVPFVIRFLREAEPEAEEVELSEEDCDVMPLEGERIDMGEAVAQTLALNLDPYPRAPDAERFLREMGVKSEEESGPLSGLRDLIAKGKG